LFTDGSDDRCWFGFGEVKVADVGFCYPFSGWQLYRVGNPAIAKLPEASPPPVEMDIHDGMYGWHVPGSRSKQPDKNLEFFVHKKCQQFTRRARSRGQTS
jgi:hypothetical protein